MKIISASDLIQNLCSEDPPVVLDVRGMWFHFGHIPCSRRFNWRDWTQERASLWNAFFGRPECWGKLPVWDASKREIEIDLGQLGLENARPIVICGSGNKGWGEEGRVAWNLLTWGALNVSILDGGFQAWRGASGQASWRGKPRAQCRQSLLIADQPSRFHVSLVEARRATCEDLMSRLASTASDEKSILDARSSSEFSGRRSFGLKRGGAIPGAKLVPFDALFQSDGTFVSAANLRDLKGATSHDPPITYCTGGVRSALLAMLIEARLGVVCANYDGSMLEWSRKTELPILCDL